MSEYVSLQFQAVGSGRVTNIREGFKDNQPTGKSYLTLVFEGGQIEIQVETTKLENVEMGDIVQVWLTLQPFESGYMYQGRFISRLGFRVLNLIQIEVLQVGGGSSALQ